MLGAAALEDIGVKFPDTDPRFKDAKSSFFVEESLRMVRERGLEVASMDSIVFADSPRISPYRERICQSIATMLSLGIDCVSVKGRSFEGLGAIGKGEAVAAQVVVLLRENE
jgi:2-C-methyl-D-erythritol 2,4-cyclodiphosphate synthase